MAKTIGMGTKPKKEVDESKELKALKKENATLKKEVASLKEENETLKAAQEKQE